MNSTQYIEEYLLNKIEESLISKKILRGTIKLKIMKYYTENESFKSKDRFKEYIDASNLYATLKWRKKFTKKCNIPLIILVSIFIINLIYPHKNYTSTLIGTIILFALLFSFLFTFFYLIYLIVKLKKFFKIRKKDWEFNIK